MMVSQSCIAALKPPKPDPMSRFLNGMKPFSWSAVLHLCQTCLLLRCANTSVSDLYVTRTTFQIFLFTFFLVNFRLLVRLLLESKYFLFAHLLSVKPQMPVVIQAGTFCISDRLCKYVPSFSMTSVRIMLSAFSMILLRWPHLGLLTVVLNFLHLQNVPCYSPSHQHSGTQQTECVIFKEP